MAVLQKIVATLPSNTASPSAALLVLVLGVIATLALTLYRRHRASSELKLPFLRFEDGDDSRQRYATDSGTLFKIGYEKYLKHGQAFAMRNYVDELKPQVFLPLKYLDELKNVPESKLSLRLNSEVLFCQDYTGTAKQTDESTHVIKYDLVRNLPLLFPVIADEAAPAVEKVFPPSSDWVTVTTFPLISYAVARLAARIVVGPELCANDEWLNLCITMVNTSMQAANALRGSWPSWARWASPYLFEPIKKVQAEQRRAAEILRPVLEARRLAATQGIANGDGKGNKEPRVPQFNDAVQWLENYYRGRRRKLTLEELAQHELFYAIATIHSSTMVALSVLYDLIDERNKDAREVIIDEIEQTQSKYGTWTRAALGSLGKLDSFMKESQRLNFVGHARLTRVAKVGYTFKDGLYVPKGTMLQILHSGHQLDPEFYDEPLSFDPWRFLRKRQVAGDENKFQFDSLSDIETQFGAGIHACPARNSATASIKLILILLITQYDLRFEGESQRRPPNIGHDHTTFPNPGIQIQYRLKAKSAVSKS